jgi:hypothetical protein
MHRPSPEMAAGFKDFFTHPGSARHVAFVKHALVDIHRSTEVEALITILLKFKTSLQTLSFTLPSSISNRTYATFDRCFATILNHVSALVLPTYNDGDASNIPSKQPDHVRNAWNIFSPRSQEQIADIEKYNKLAGRRNSDRICNKGFSELAHWPHIRKLTVEMSLAVKLRKNASSGENSGRELDIFIAPFAPVHLSRKLVAEKNGREVVELSIIHEITSPITVPIGPIFANMGWSDPLKLRSFNAATTDFTFYGACMLSDEPDEVPRDFIVPALESLRLHNCTGLLDLFKGCHKEKINLDTFIFTNTVRETDGDEVDALASFIGTSTNIRNLCLNFAISWIPTPWKLMERDIAPYRVPSRRNHASGKVRPRSLNLFRKHVPSVASLWQSSSPISGTLSRVSRSVRVSITLSLTQTSHTSLQNAVFCIA